MKINRQIVFWLAALVAMVVFLQVFSSILLPFVGGMAMAYLLDPLAHWIEQRGFSRLAATLTIMVVALLVIVAILLLVVPILINQLSLLISDLPSYVAQLDTLIEAILKSRWAKSLGVDPEVVRSSISGIFNQWTSWATGVIGSVWSSGLAVINILALVVVAPIVAIYLLYDWDRMIGLIDSWLPRDHVEVIRGLAREINRVIAGFVRGQALVSLTLGVFYAGGLVLLGVNFGFLIGLVAGIISFIPYLGTTFGFIASVGLALLQFWPDWVWPVATAGLFILGQLLEGYVLQPFFIGNNVGLHPVWLMFALFAFGLLFGFVGLLIAIPAAAAVGVLVRYGLSRYLASPIYRGTTGEPDPATGMSGKASRPPRQMPLGLPHRAALGRADFIVGRANHEAIDIIDRWPSWPERGVLLVGPAGSGKSHLTAIWQEASGAAAIAASKLADGDVERLTAAAAIVVEDLHAGPVDEAALFHLVNAAREAGAALLLTSRLGPTALRFRLPDLVSRLRAITMVELREPDDALLRQVLTKLFADRQLLIEPAVVDFIVMRMERSLEAANVIVDQLDADALAETRAITKRLAGEVLGRFANRQTDLWNEE